MTKKEYFVLYNIEKLGFITTDKKQCLCGTDMNINEKACPKCGTRLPKSKLINVNKIKTIGKKFSSSFENDVFIIYAWQLQVTPSLMLSERVNYQFTINTQTKEVSHWGDFRLMDSADFLELLKKQFPGYVEYVMKFRAINVPELSKIPTASLARIFTVYWSFQGLAPYMDIYSLSLKLLRELKEKYREIDFNNSESVKKLPFNLHLLKICNEKTTLNDLIQLSNTVTYKKMDIIETIIKRHEDNILDCSKYDQLSKAFEMLFRKEISIENFTRLFLRSGIINFYRISEAARIYKSVYKVPIDWSEVYRIDEKLIYTLSLKRKLIQEYKMSLQDIEELYTILKTDPVKALQTIIDLYENMSY